MTISAHRNAPIQDGVQSLARRLAQAPDARAWRRIRGGAEGVALVIALAACARAVLVVAAPIPAPTAVETGLAADFDRQAVAAYAGGNPFRSEDNSPAASSAPLTESALNIVLYGTWRDAASETAVISADGAPQRKVAVGEEIVAGVTLEEVQDQFVVISNNGAREAVAIVNRKVDMTVPAPAQEAVSEDAPSPAPLRGAEAVAPVTVSAGAVALRDDRSANTIAAAAPHEPE